MITDAPKLPLGMRLNNPGNLRAAHGLNKPSKLVDGFNDFDSLIEGTFSLCKLTADYYFIHGWRTLSAFVGHYAPATENDLTKYMAMMAAKAHLNIMLRETADLRLDRAWYALDFMRAIVHVEQGGCHPDFRTYPEWVPIGYWEHCMRDIPQWAGQL